MFRLSIQMKKFMLMLATGAMLFQAAGCDVFEILQTTFLGVITGTTLYLASNV